MQSLLRWGIENSTPSDSGSTVAPRNDLDPAIIDHILGKPDAVLMKEAMEVAVDENQSDDARAQALDDLEQLVENIDNANDLSKLKMWEPLHSLVTKPNSSENIKTQTLWVIGTAVQNNPRAQKDYLSMHPIPAVLSLLSSVVESSLVKSKAVYALSGLCKHSAAAVRELEECGGWEVLRSALEDCDITVRRKTAFLLNSLLIPSESSSSETNQPPSNIVHANSHASMVEDPSSMTTSHLTLKALEDRGILLGLLNALIAPLPHGKDGERQGDIDFEEKAVQLLCTYVKVRGGGGFRTEVVPKSSLVELKGYLEGHVTDSWGIDREELEGLVAASC